MKIRHTLYVLIVAVGTGLSVSVMAQLRDATETYRAAKTASISNATREQLLELAIRLSEERRAGFVLLRAPAGTERDPLDLARRRSDAAMIEAQDIVLRHAADLPLSPQQVRRLGVERSRLNLYRAALDEELRTRFDEPRDFIGRAWFMSMSGLIERIQTFRLEILRRHGTAEPPDRTETLLRHYVSELRERTARVETLLAGELEEGASMSGWPWQNIAADIDRGDMMLQMIEAEILASRPARHDASEAWSLIHQYDRLVNPLNRWRSGEASSLPTNEIEMWRAEADRMIRGALQEQNELIEISREKIAAAMDAARRSMSAWMITVVLGLGAVVACIAIMHFRVVVPLYGFNDRMLRLAQGDLAVGLPRSRRTSEIDQMYAALRVFKMNAVRRRRAEKVQASLHNKLEDVYRQLRADLDAAAVVQRTLLPESGKIDGIDFRSSFRPTSFIAGDTYNVVRQGDGRIGFFLVDVAGHGAPAALVSVATHYELMQAMRRRRGMDRIERMVARINTGWPPDLTYFTLIVGEIDPDARLLRFVQAGHPYPIIITAAGDVAFAGKGGPPVGLFERAVYDVTECRFGPGDKLLLYTDGLTDAENANGEPFTEARLKKLAEAHSRRSADELIDVINSSLSEWSGTADIDDDVSILILEYTRVEALNYAQT